MPSVFTCACDGRLLPMHRVCVSPQNDGQSSLHYCLKFKFHALADLLISYGADEFLTNKHGLTAYEGLTPSDLED